MNTLKSIINFWAEVHKLSTRMIKPDDLKVLKCSPNVLHNVKIGQGQLRLIITHILFYHI